MGKRLDDYFTGVFSGVGEGVADITRSVIADVGSAYQRFLTADATVGPASGLTGTVETVSYDMERVELPAALEADPVSEVEPHDIDIEP